MIRFVWTIAAGFLLGTLLPSSYSCLLAQQQIPSASKSNSSASGGSGDAASANDPSEPLTQIQIQDWYHPTYDGVPGEGNEFLFRPIVPFDGRGLVPSSLVRLEIPVMSTPNGRTGLGDIQFISWFFPGYKPKSKIKIGIGPVLVAPSATNRFAGQGQWQVGPSTIIIYHGIKDLVLGAIIDNPITIAGVRTRPGINAMTFQPLIIKVLPKNYFLRFDPYWVFDWKEHGSATIPLNLGFGRLIKIHNQLVNVYIQPEFLARRPLYAGNYPPRFTLRFAFHLLYPKSD